MKVFGIGFHKTGTSTLGTALTELGYSVCGVRLDLAKSLLKDDFDAAYSVTEEYDAFQDNPWPIIFRQLDKWYPDSKFILTVRDEETWIKSVVNHFGNNETDMRKYIYGVGHPRGNEEIYLNRYKKHNQDVIDFFKDRDDKLLVLSWEKGDGWEELCGFLNKPVPEKSFPHVNKRTYSTAKKMYIKTRKWLKSKK